MRRLAPLVLGLAVIGCGGRPLPIRPSARSFTAGDYERIYTDWTRESDDFSFGRLEDDDIRVAIITRDRRFPARELLGRVEAEGRRVAHRFRAFSEEDAAAVGRHLTRGDLSVRDVAERLIVGHLEGHVTQLREAISAAS